MGERPYSLAALAREIRARPSPTRTRLVAIDGCGSAGKSTLARALAAVCGGVSVVQVDDFLFWHGLERWWEPPTQPL
jgi:chloramphenicol 3-O-phosphotransferase